ncbi:MAG: phosphate starvation-inducible protein PhoH, partial [Coriobacteriales bacterium]|nr:phosphate starvation-inducible protein PhoH [Coriobacteriales bacterium]
MEPTHVRLTIPDSVDPGTLMGPADVLLRRIEESFDAMITVRGNQVSVVGAPDVVDQVTSVFSRLIQMAMLGEEPSLPDVDLMVGQVRRG